MGVKASLSLADLTERTAEVTTEFAAHYVNSYAAQLAGCLRRGDEDVIRCVCSPNWLARPCPYLARV